MISTALARFRGDNYPLTVTFPDDVDISGFVVTLSVSAEAKPAEAAYALQKTATLDVESHKAVFGFTVEDVDLCGRFYYDVQVADGGTIYTVAKGTWTFEQDITK